MKKHILFALSAALMCFSIESNAQKWTNLFDGKTFKGFKQLGGKAIYEVKDGVMVGTTVPNTGNSFMATEEEYGDFILEVDVKVDNKMNSGIQFRSLSIPTYNNGVVHGYQAEIDPSTRGWSGGIYDESRRGWLAQNELKPEAKKAFKLGDVWNHYRIEAIGNTIRTWINDVPVTYLVDDMTAKGFIAFQVHAIYGEMKPGMQVMWKNIRIQTGKDMQPRPLDGKTVVDNYMLNNLSEQEKLEGFKLLFNGKDLTGFRSAFKTTAPPSVWTVEEGTLHVNSSGGKESGNGGDILTNEQFGAFELTFDFKLTEGANSGVKYFVNETYDSGMSAIGLEYQVLDDAKHPDAKLGTVGNRTLASLYDIIPSNKLDPRFRRKIGDWNQGRIIVYPNNIVQHWLNGFKVLEYERKSNIFKVLVAHSKHAKWDGFGMQDKGPILFQEHGDSVFYKNIKIREIN
ncbi:MAG: hypothetical protein RI981_353 [Bacteroidota bacterium]|jgi:hypothetical protein